MRELLSGVLAQCSGQWYKWVCSDSVQCSQWHHLLPDCLGENVVVVCFKCIIDLFRGACAFKENVQVAGHVKRVDHGDAFHA